MKITIIEHKMPELKPLTKVAAYARVSMESERLSHSLAAQVSYYSELIQSNPEWEYAGVYADSFISGTDAGNRPELQRLIADCEAGKVNIVLVKSISRFARNTVDLLNIVRHLKDIDVSVRFEKENIDSLTADGELMLAILAGFAEEESKSISSNIKWSIRKKFERGETWHTAAFGYRWDGETFRVQEDEADVVRRIYRDFLNDVPLRHIAAWMKKEGWPGCNVTTVKYILQNITYTGNVITQKYFVPDPLTHECRKNEGQLPRHFIANNHEAIISQETFDAVQQKIKDNYEFNKEAHRFTKPSCFSAKLVCPWCGANFVSYPTKSNKHDGLQENWRCFGKIKYGKDSCPSKSITGARLKESCCIAFGMDDFDENIICEKVQRITPTDDGKLIFTLYDGSVRTAPVKYFNQADKKHTDPHSTFFGYQWSRDGYVVIPDQIEAVRLIYGYYADGMTISDISRKLTAAGYRSYRGMVSNKLIAQALDSVLYIGHRILKGQFTESGKDELLLNDHEAVISEELNDRVKARRKIELKKQERRLATVRAKKEAMKCSKGQ